MHENNVLDRTASTVRYSHLYYHPTAFSLVSYGYIGNSQQRCRQNEDEGNACVVVVVVVVVVVSVDGNGEDGARRQDAEKEPKPKRHDHDEEGSSKIIIIQRTTIAIRTRMVMVGSL